MEKRIKERNLRYGFIIIALFLFFRVAFMLTTSFYGITIPDLNFSFTTRGIILLVLFLLFAIMMSHITVMTYKRYGEKSFIVCYLLLADMSYIAINVNCINLILVNLCLIFICHTLYGSNKTIDRIALPLFMFVFAILSPPSMLNLASLVMTIHIISGDFKSKKNIGFIVSVVLALLLSVAGVIINLTVFKNNTFINDLISTYSFSDFGQGKYAKLFCICLTIPYVIFLIVFTSMYLKETNKEARAKKKSKNNNYILDLSRIFVVLNIVGIFFWKTIYATNLSIVLLIALMLSKGDTCSNAVIEKMFVFCKNNKFAAILILLLHSFISAFLINKLYPGSSILAFAVRYV